MKSKNFSTILIAAVCLLSIPCSAFAAGNAVHGTTAHVTLWQLLKAGGWTMIVLGVLSVLSLTMIFYNFLTLKMELLVPSEFTDGVMMRLEAHDLQGARALCEKKKANMITPIVLAGINRFSRGKIVMREAMEKALQKEISKLWKAISYLGDIASIAPLLGLLGTVIGMIQAFNVISTAGTALKPMMLVGGISKALITTASGLVVAIPTLGFYSYFRGIVQDIADIVDDYSTDIIKLISESPSLEPASKLATAFSPSKPISSSETETGEVLSHA